MRGKGARGQTLVEFAIAGTIFLAALIGIVSFSVSAWMGAEVDFKTAELASELPANWASLDRKALVKNLMTEQVGLDPARLTVESASVDTRSASVNAADDRVARALGSDTSHTDATWVTVKARVSYKVTSPSVILGAAPTTYTRDVERVYLLQRRYEVS